MDTTLLQETTASAPKSVNASLFSGEQGNARTVPPENTRYSDAHCHKKKIRTVLVAIIGVLITIVVVLSVAISFWISKLQKNNGGATVNKLGLYKALVRCNTFYTVHVLPIHFWSIYWYLQ